MKISAHYSDASTQDFYAQQSTGAAYNYAIVRHPAWMDIENAPGMDNLLPSAQKISDDPSERYKGDTIPIYPQWWSYIEKINAEYPKGYDYARSVGSLWINIDYRPENKTPRSECVMSGSNFIAWKQDGTSETTTHVKIETYSHLMDTSQLDPIKDNWFLKPWLFWKASAYNRAGATFKVWGGVDSFIPQIKSSPAWIEKVNIQILPRGLNYRFFGTDVYLNGEPMLIVDKYGNRTVNKLGITVPSVNPPVGWKQM